MRSKCVPGFVWFTESTLGGIHVRMNAPPPFFKILLKREASHTYGGYYTYPVLTLCHWRLSLFAFPRIKHI